MWRKYAVELFLMPMLNTYYQQSGNCVNRGGMTVQFPDCCTYFMFMSHYKFQYSNNNSIIKLLCFPSFVFGEFPPRYLQMKDCKERKDNNKMELPAYMAILAHPH